MSSRKSKKKLERSHYHPWGGEFYGWGVTCSCGSRNTRVADSDYECQQKTRTVNCSDCGAVATFVPDGKGAWKLHSRVDRGGAPVPP